MKKIKQVKASKVIVFVFCLFAVMFFTPKAFVYAEEVTITYKPNGGAGADKKVQVEKDSPISLPENTFGAPANKIFVGWEIDLGYGPSVYHVGEKVSFSGDTNVNAKWAVTSGKCGPNGKFEWSYENRKLLVTGTGELTLDPEEVEASEESGESEQAPWAELAYDIETITLGPDIDGVSGNVFGDCSNAKKFFMRDTTLPPADAPTAQAKAIYQADSEAENLVAFLYTEGEKKDAYHQYLTATKAILIGESADLSELKCNDPSSPYFVTQVDDDDDTVWKWDTEEQKVDHFENQINFSHAGEIVDKQYCSECSSKRELVVEEQELDLDTARDLAQKAVDAVEKDYWTWGERGSVPNSRDLIYTCPKEFAYIVESNDGYTVGTVTATVFTNPDDTATACVVDMEIEWQDAQGNKRSITPDDDVDLMVEIPAGDLALYTFAHRLPDGALEISTEKKYVNGKCYTFMPIAKCSPFVLIALRPKYTIKFVNEDGTVLQSDEVKYGDMPSYSGKLPTKPADEKYTYTFAGWKPELEAVTGKAAYTATYDSELRKYTIKFVNEDGTVLQSDEVKYGDMPSYRGKTPTKPADGKYTYTFAGWEPEITKVTGEVTYKAKYTAEPVKAESTEVAKASEPQTYQTSDSVTDGMMFGLSYMMLLSCAGLWILLRKKKV